MHAMADPDLEQRNGGDFVCMCSHTDFSSLCIISLLKISHDKGEEVSTPCPSLDPPLHVFLKTAITLVEYYVG